MKLRSVHCELALTFFWMGLLPDDGQRSKKTTAPLRFFVNVESSSGQAIKIRCEHCGKFQSADGDKGAEKRPICYVQQKCNSQALTYRGVSKCLFDLNSQCIEHLSLSTYRVRQWNGLSSTTKLYSRRGDSSSDIMHILLYTHFDSSQNKRLLRRIFHFIV